MIAWHRIPDGWAVNLDGTDASLVFTLPRVEVLSGPSGWQAQWFFEDGTRSGRGRGYPGGLTAAKSGALAEARRFLPARYDAVMRSLGASGR